LLLLRRNHLTFCGRVCQRRCITRRRIDESTWASGCVSPGVSSGGAADQPM